MHEYTLDGRPLPGPLGELT